MAQTKQYLIRCLDKWYYHRHQDYYTEQAALPLQYHAGQMLHKKLPKDIARCMHARLGYYLSRNTRLIQAKTFFSDVHKKIAATTRNGYTIEAPEDHIINVDNFITELRRFDAQKFPDEWTDDEIDDVLQMSFPDLLTLTDIVQTQVEQDIDDLTRSLAGFNYPERELKEAYSRALYSQVKPITRIIFNDMLKI